MSTHPHAFMAWTRATLPLHLNLFKSESVVKVSTFQCLLLLTLQPYMSFGLLHQIIPEFSIVKNVDQISSFWLLQIIYYFISPFTLWSSFSSYP